MKKKYRIIENRVCPYRKCGISFQPKRKNQFYCVTQHGRKEYRATHPEEVRLWHKNWVKENPEKHKDYQQKSKVKRFGSEAEANKHDYEKRIQNPLFKIYHKLYMRHYLRKKNKTPVESWRV